MKLIKFLKNFKLNKTLMLTNYKQQKVAAQLTLKFNDIMSCLIGCC